MKKIIKNLTTIDESIVTGMDISSPVGVILPVQTEVVVPKRIKKNRMSGKRRGK